MKSEDDRIDIGQLAPSKVHQRSKIQQVKQALVEEGFITLDKQARALGLSRSTTYSILQQKHKTTGLSTGIILRMLSQPDLPSRVRTRLIEYINEKTMGLYGDKPFRRREFMRRLSLTNQEPSTDQRTQSKRC